MQWFSRALLCGRTRGKEEENSTTSDFPLKLLRKLSFFFCFSSYLFLMHTKLHLISLWFPWSANRVEVKVHYLDDKGYFILSFFRKLIYLKCSTLVIRIGYYSTILLKTFISYRGRYLAAEYPPLLRPKIAVSKNKLFWNISTDPEFKYSNSRSIHWKSLVYWLDKHQQHDLCRRKWRRLRSKRERRWKNFRKLKLLSMRRGKFKVFNSKLSKWKQIICVLWKKRSFFHSRSVNMKIFSGRYRKRYLLISGSSNNIGDGDFKS